jgi:hypothetical protein
MKIGQTRGVVSSEWRSSESDGSGSSPGPRADIDPSWLRWGGGIITRLALAAYQDRQSPSGRLDPVRLAVLADALEDAGCTDRVLLEHLRDPGPHEPSCWAVRALLGKR